MGRHIIDERDLTTGQVAKVCQVAPRTVSAWIDNGKLQGYRLPPVSGTQKAGADRRVQRKHLEEFMIENRMPVERLRGVCWGALFVSPTRKIYDELRSNLPDDSLIVVDYARDIFDAGLQIAGLRPKAVVIDFMLSLSEVHRVINGAQDMKRIVLVNEDEERSMEMVENDFAVDFAVKKPVNVEALISRLRMYRRNSKGF